MIEISTVGEYLNEINEYGSDFSLETALLSDINAGTISGTPDDWSKLELFFTGKKTANPREGVIEYLKKSFDELVKIGG